MGRAFFRVRAASATGRRCGVAGLLHTPRAMPVGAIANESDLRAFVRREIGNGPSLIRQLQGTAVADRAALEELIDGLDTRLDALELAASKTRRGVASTPGNGTASYVATVTHGLGTTPRGVQLTTNNGALLAGYTNLNATTFQIVVTAPAVGNFGPNAFETTWEAWA